MSDQGVWHPLGDANEHIARLSDEVRALIADPLPAFLKSVRQASTPESFRALTDPSTGREFARVIPGGIEEADLAVAVALDVMQGEWGACSATEREQLLHCFADLIERYQQSLAELEALATGRAFSGVADQVIPETLMWCRYLTGLSTKTDGHISAAPASLEPFRCSFRESRGVAVLRAQADQSLTRRLVPLVSALAAGCAVILLCDDAAYPGLFYLCGLLVRAGVPEGTVNLLCVGQALELQLLNHHDVFAPRELQDNSVQLLSSRMLVFDDADIDQVVDTLMMRVFSPLNPTLTTPRLHVHESIYEELIEALEGRFQQLETGFALEPSTQLGSLYHADLVSQAMELVGICQKKGLRVVCGGDSWGEGYGMELTLIADDQLRLAHMPLNSTLPVLIVQPFGYEARIVRRTNRDRGCLGVSLFTQQLQRIRRLSRELHTEQIWINSHNRMEPGDQVDPLGPYLRRRSLWVDS